MTKELALIADCFNDAYSDSGDEWDRALQHVVMNIAEALAKNNPEFDREEFLKACGIEVTNHV